MGLDALSNVLWKERELLDTLLFKLEVEELIIAHGRTRWLGRAAHDVERVLDHMRELEVGRAVEATDAASLLGLGADASLLEIAGAAPEPWNDMMHSHHLALTTVTAQIDALSHANHALLEQTLRATREALVGIEAAAGEYDPTGTPRGSDGGALLLDQDI
ncbi:flagellar export chaperone FlgN [Demequina sp.]|uniref:flagellar export chaperone FlgN n=1 Tax=Demequina sp. TaxID=2050685 RepID=UPI003A848DA7